MNELLSGGNAETLIAVISAGAGVVLFIAILSYRFLKNTPPRDY